MGLTARQVSLGQGTFNVLGGAWPLVSMRSFEAVYGPKADDWLERTVAGLLMTVGVGQLLSVSDDELRVSRRIGLGTAATLLLVDLVYVPKGRISRMYLQDLVCEAAWIAAWGAVTTRGSHGPAGRRRAGRQRS